MLVEVGNTNVSDFACVDCFAHVFPSVKVIDDVQADLGFGDRPVHEVEV